MALYGWSYGANSIALEQGRLMGFGKWMKNVFEGQNDGHPMGQAYISTTDLHLKQTCIMKKKKENAFFMEWI